jgi:hypothetical protein
MQMNSPSFLVYFGAVDLLFTFEEGDAEFIFKLLGPFKNKAGTERKT